MENLDKTLADTLKNASSDIERKLYFLGWLNERLAELGSREFPVLVGGSAVAFYTAGNYATQDIDIVYGVTKRLNDILLLEGFIKDGRYWVNEELDLLVECPGTNPPQMVTCVRLDNLTVYVSSIEDMIIDRLCAEVFWGSASDGEWARTLLASDDIDWVYLEKRAVEEDVIARLGEIKADMGLEI